MESKEDQYEYNNCPIRISFYLKVDISDIAKEAYRTKEKWRLKFETRKNTISEPMIENAAIDDAEKVKIADEEQGSYKMNNEDPNILKYIVKNLELDFSVPKLFSILLVGTENESIEGTFTLSIVDLFLRAYDKLNFKPQEVFFKNLITAKRSVSGTNILTAAEINKINIVFMFIEKIKYPKEPTKAETTYVTQKISKFVKNTTSYDVIVKRHDFNFFKSLFFKPYTQLVVSYKNGPDDKDRIPIYQSPIFVNALFFKIDTFNILTSKYIDNKGIPLNQYFTLVDWTHKKSVNIYDEPVQKREDKNQEEKPNENIDYIAYEPKKQRKVREDEESLLGNQKKNDNKKYFSVEKRDLSEQTFVQLLCMGVKIQTIIAIDFSSSNRPVLIKDSRHSGDSHTNLYLGAMNTIFDTLAIFDENNSVSLYGLCAKIKGVFHEYFPITKMSNEKDDNSENNKYSSKDTMEKAYNYYRQMLQFWGPTKLSGFLNHAKDKAEKAFNENKNTYTVVTIITDGLIVDLRDIVDSISEMSMYPVYIVFVGIGEEKSDREFLLLKQIDDNLNQIKNDNKKDAIHDIVKFVHFKTENLVEKSSFSQKLFYDIPDEVVRFMNQKKKDE